MKLVLKQAVAVILLILSFATPVAAGPLEDAVAAYNSGDYATALRLYRPLADKGDVTAQTNVGVMYYNGQGAWQDYAEALKWFRLAAGHGSAYAQLNLAVMYRDGHGVQQDYMAAYRLFSFSAAQGNTEAVKGRDNIVALMTPAQVAEAEAQIAALKQMPAQAIAFDAGAGWLGLKGKTPKGEQHCTVFKGVSDKGVFSIRVSKLSTMVMFADPALATQVHTNMVMVVTQAGTPQPMGIGGVVRALPKGQLILEGVVNGPALGVFEKGESLYVITGGARLGPYALVGIDRAVAALRSCFSTL